MDKCSDRAIEITTIEIHIHTYIYMHTQLLCREKERARKKEKERKGKRERERDRQTERETERDRERERKRDRERNRERKRERERESERQNERKTRQTEHKFCKPTCESKSGLSETAEPPEPEFRARFEPGLEVWVEPPLARLSPLAAVGWLWLKLSSEQMFSSGERSFGNIYQSKY